MATTHFFGTRPQVNHIRDFLQSYLPFGMLDASLRKEFGNDLERIIDHLATANLKECAILRQQLLEAQEDKITSLGNKLITSEQQKYLQTQLEESKNKFFTACEQPRIHELLAHLEQYLFTPEQELSTIYVPSHLEEYFSTQFEQLHDKLKEQLNNSLPHAINELLLRYNDIYVHLNKPLQQKYQNFLDTLYTTSLDSIHTYCQQNISPEEYRHINTYIKLYRSRSPLSSKEINKLFPSLRKKITSYNHDAIFYCFEHFSFSEKEKKGIGHHIQTTIQDNFFTPSTYRTVLDVPFLQPYIKESYHQSLINHQSPSTLEQTLLLYKNSIKNFTSFLSDQTTINFFSQQLKNLSMSFTTLVDTLSAQPLSEHLESIAYTSLLTFSPLLLSPKHFKRYSFFVKKHDYNSYYSQLTPENILDTNSFQHIVTNTLSKKKDSYTHFLNSIPRIAEQLIFSDENSKMTLYQSLTSLKNHEVLHDIISHIIEDLEELPLEESSTPSQSLAHYLHQAHSPIPYAFPSQSINYILNDIQPQTFSELSSRYTQYASYFNVSQEIQRKDMESFIIHAISNKYPQTHSSCSLKQISLYMQKHHKTSLLFALPALFEQAINNHSWAQSTFTTLTQHSPHESIHALSSFISSDLSSLEKYNSLLAKQTNSSFKIHSDVSVYLDNYISSHLIRHMTNIFVDNCTNSTHNTFVAFNHIPSTPLTVSSSTLDKLKPYHQYLIHPLYTPLLHILREQPSFRFTPSSTKLQKYILEYNSKANAQYHFKSLCNLESDTTSYTSTEQLYDKVYFFSLFNYLTNESPESLRKLKNQLITLPGITKNKLYLDLLTYSKNYSFTLNNIFSTTSSAYQKEFSKTLLNNHYLIHLSSQKVEDQLLSLPNFIKASQELIQESHTAKQTCSNICSYYFTISTKLSPYHNEQLRKKVLNEITTLAPDLLTEEAYFIHYYAQKIYGTLLHEGYTIKEKCSHISHNFPTLSQNTQLLSSAISHLIHHYDPTIITPSKQHYVRVLDKNLKQLSTLDEHTTFSTQLYNSLAHINKPSSL